MNIYVGNLNYRLQEDDLREVFANYGEVTSVKLISDRITGRAKGFGFVEMANDEQGKQAVENLDGSELMDREMRVNEARPRNDNR